MPNWVRNVVMFTCSSERLNDIRSTLKSEDRVFDFNKLIPMPESLKLDEGSHADKAEECYRAYIMDNEQRTKEKYKISDDAFEKLKREGKIYASNREKYGHRSWYSWRCENWGTKWNAREPQWVDNDTIVFETAWNCPKPIFKKLAETFPDIGIFVKYADEDIGFNCGTLEYADGELYAVDIEPDGSYDFAFDVWDYDDDSRKEFLEEIGE